MTKTEQVVSKIAARIVPKLRALAVGESLRVRGLVVVTRRQGEDRFEIAGDGYAQKASEAAYNAVAADFAGQTVLDDAS